MAEESRYADDPDTDADFRRLADLRDGPGKARLRGQIICAWLPMAHRLAARYRNRGETLEDLRQVAAIGLVNAVDRYDPDIGRAFAPFAVPTITGRSNGTSGTACGPCTSPAGSRTSATSSASPAPNSPPWASPLSRPDRRAHRAE